MLANPRIVSLIPAAAEIVAALGYRKALVGRSHECDHPPEVRSLPVLTRPRFNGAGSSREIDQIVRRLAAEARAADAIGIYEVLFDELRAARPTHLVTQTQCDVCAVGLKDVEAAVERMVGDEVRVVSLAATTLDEVWEDFERVAESLDDEAAGRQLVTYCRERLSRLQERAAAAAERPSVVVLEWMDPLMTAGHWTPTLVETAGGRCLLGAAGGRSRPIDFDDLLAADPEVILVAPCGYGLQRAAADVRLLTKHKRSRELRAVRDGRVHAADGNQYFNRSGPRLVDSAEVLAEILHPGRFEFGRQGEAWKRVKA